jgi:hypothetical protein
MNLTVHSGCIRVGAGSASKVASPAAAASAEPTAAGTRTVSAAGTRTVSARPPNAPRRACDHGCSVTGCSLMVQGGTPYCVKHRPTVLLEPSEADAECVLPALACDAVNNSGASEGDTQERTRSIETQVS